MQRRVTSTYTIPHEAMYRKIAQIVLRDGKVALLLPEKQSDFSMEMFIFDLRFFAGKPLKWHLASNIKSLDAKRPFVYIVEVDES